MESVGVFRRLSPEQSVIPPPPDLRFKVASDEEIGDFVRDLLRSDDADDLEDRLFEHPALHARVLRDREEMRQKKIVPVPVMFKCEEFALGLAAYDRTPAEFQIDDFWLHITCQNTPEMELVVFATAVWNGTDTAIPAVPQSLQLSYKESVLGSITEWSRGLGEGRWVGNAVIAKSARIGIAKTDEFEAAFL